MASSTPPATTTYEIPRSKITDFVAEVLDLDPATVTWVSINGRHITAQLSIPISDKVLHAALGDLKSKHPGLGVNGNNERIETSVVFHISELL